jgi:hypothetical protein
LRALLSLAFPEVAWQPWRFEPVPRGLWAHESHVRAYVRWLEGVLGVQERSDWYRVAYAHVARRHGAALLQRHGGLLGLLRRVYPDYAWRAARFRPEALERKGQAALAQQVAALFPEHEVREDARLPHVRYASGQAVEADVWVPRARLVLEYQGQQHYRDHELFGPHAQARARDADKAARLAAVREDVVAVPYWWDAQPRSLAASIRAARADLLPEWAHADEPSWRIPAEEPRRKGRLLHPAPLSSPWSLVRGQARGRAPRCRGCGLPFSERTALRIAAEEVTPLQSRACFHVSEACVRAALHKDVERVLPVWSGEVHLPATLAAASENLAAPPAGIVWLRDES